MTPPHPPPPQQLQTHGQEAAEDPAEAELHRGATSLSSSSQRLWGQGYGGLHRAARRAQGGPMLPPLSEPWGPQCPCAGHRPSTRDLAPELGHTLCPELPGSASHRGLYSWLRQLLEEVSGDTLSTLNQTPTWDCPRHGSPGRGQEELRTRSQLDKQPAPHLRGRVGA